MSRGRVQDAMYRLVESTTQVQKIPVYNSSMIIGYNSMRWLGLG